MLESLTEHQLLVFWTQLLVLVATARLFGTILRRIGLPGVIGELAAGLVLGPSVFGRLWPDGFDWFLPDDPVQSGMLQSVAWLGVGLLLVLTGFETDLGLIGRQGRAAVLVSAGSLMVPFAGGLAVGFALPEAFVGDGAERTVFALFVATALAVSSLAVVAKILSELGFMRRDFGQLTVAVGMANDLVGWVLLGIITGLAVEGTVSLSGIATTIVGIAVIGVLAVTVGQRVVDWSLRRVRRQGENLEGALTITLIFALTIGVATQWLGVEALLGMFVAGVVLARSRFHQAGVVATLETVTLTFFAPLFFATAGLRVDLGLLADGEALMWAVVIIVVALTTKFAGAFIGARVARLTTRESVALGAGLNARGALEIIIATVGLGLGVLNDTAFTAIVLVPIVTSLAASGLLRLTVRGWSGTSEEQARLEREEVLSRNVVVREQRILLPSRGTANSIAAAQVLHFAWPAQAAVTVMSVGDSLDEESLQPVVDVLHERSVEVHRVGGDDPAAEILAEAQLGYGVIGVGASDLARAGGVITPLVDRLLSQSPLPVVIVRRARDLDRALPGAFTRAVVPVTGSRSSRAAQEIAGELSAELGTELLLAHVTVPKEAAARSRPGGYRWQGASLLDTGVGAGLLVQAQAHAEGLGARVRTAERRAENPADEILALVDDEEADLIVVGASVRRLDDRPFLGHTVEAILEHATATVVVVVPGAAAD
ncbi:MAG TPA: cation:proton antiporter [Acidimicrobiales bacterium]|nr:cation:proton antiporter [Acidimicrobiales bacterium]